jgi:hypothetical protein
MSDLDLLRRLGDQIVPPPLDELRATARRRGRRTAVVTACAAAAAVAVVLVTAHEWSTESHSAPPVKEPEVHARPMTYAVGDVVHYGPTTVTMPGRVVELDLTDDGVVARVEDGGIWFTDGAEPEQTGDVGESAWGDSLWNHYVGRMVSGNSGSLVAWLEFPHPWFPKAVVYDTDAGREIIRSPIDPRGTGSATGLFSVDPDAVYGFTDLTFGEDLSPNWRIDTTTGEQSPETLEHYQRSLAASATRTVLVSNHPDPASFVPFDGLLLFAIKDSRVEPVEELDRGRPYFVLDGRTGRDFRFSVPADYPDTEDVALVQWSDDDTVVLHAERADGADLLECRVSTATCAVSVQVPSGAVVPEIGKVVPGDG